MRWLELTTARFILCAAVGSDYSHYTGSDLCMVVASDHRESYLQVVVGSDHGDSHLRAVVGSDHTSPFSCTVVGSDYGWISFARWLDLTMGGPFLPTVVGSDHGPFLGTVVGSDHGKSLSTGGGWI
ncbi:hypothetical protein B0H11DRAFT_1207787 [Mycena galericulata]|nr:hypothetical protein B0H11DRAFT_1207787 [Mycena galericulata]